MPRGLEDALSASGDQIGTARTTYSVSDITSNGSTAFGTVVIRPDLATWFDYKGIRYLPTKSGATTLQAVDAAYGINDFDVELPQKFTLDGKQYTVTGTSNYLLCGQTIMTRADVTYPFTTLPNGFAYNAVSLKQVTIPSTVTSLGKYCFAGTDSLQTVALPEGLQKFDLAAFYYSGIKTLTVPSTVALMDNASMAGCRRLKELTFADGPGQVLIGWHPTMFGNRPMFQSSPLEKVTIGRNLDYYSTVGYGYSPFCGDTLLRTVVVTDVPTEMRTNMFRACKYLLDVSVGNGVRTVGANAFYGCAALDSVFLGTGVTALKEDAFAGCAAMRKLYCAATVPPTCSARALTDINKQTCTLYVPNGSVDAYKAAFMWKDFYNIEGTNISVGSVLGTDTGRFVVYTLGGTRVLDTTDAEIVNQLPAGIYIVNGRKTVIK